MTLATQLEETFDALARVFPPRSLTGMGNRKSLDVLETVCGPIRRIEVESGKKVFDWTAPKEFVLREAYCIDPNGNRRWDVKSHALHLLGYSQPFSGTVTRAELDEHLYSDPARPAVIPYCTSYWEPKWGFCLSDAERRKLPEGNYRVHIDAEHIDGHMTLGEIIIKGETNRECLLTSYICHPGILAQNENSGPLVLAYLARAIKAWPNRRYTYRIAFLVETVGAIAYLAQPLSHALGPETLGDHLRQWCDFGYVLTCLGRGDFTYKRSRAGDTLADRAAEHMLRWRKGKDWQFPADVFRNYFVDRGSDELSLNSLGFQLPIGSVMRDQYGLYDTYHGSADDKANIEFGLLANSVATYERILQTAEANQVYRSTVVHGVPQFGRRGLYSAADVHPMLALTQFCDGQTDLLAVAERTGLPIERLAEAAERAIAAGVLERV